MVRTQQFTGRGGLALIGDVLGNPSDPGVVLLHGGGQTRHSWQETADRLAAVGFHVISLDARGHGESAWAPDGDYSLDAFSGDLRAVIATMAGPPALVGASLGGITSLATAGESAEPIVSALVLVDVVPRINQEGSRRIGAFMSANPNGFASLEEAADAVAAYLPHRPRPKDVSGLRRNLRTAADGRLHWHWDPKFIEARALRPLSQPARLEDAARHVTVPTLVVRGTNSEIVTPEGIKALMELIPGAELVDIQGAHHMVAGDKNTEFRAAVVDFLTRKLLPKVD